MRLTFGPDHMVFHTAAPFSGAGVSLYVSTGATIQYRDQRLDCEWSLGADPDITKTTRVASASSPATSISIPTTGYDGQMILVDIRTYQDDVENESNSPQLITIDSGGDGVAAILGTATLLSTEQRDGGIVRIRFVWTPSDIGLQPDTFTAIRTAGPTSPASVDYTAGTGRQLIEIDTPALSDASAYTYKIRATAGSTTLDVLTGISLQADATGPTAPTVTIEEW